MQEVNVEAVRKPPGLSLQTVRPLAWNRDCSGCRERKHTYHFASSARCGDGNQNQEGNLNLHEDVLQALNEAVEQGAAPSKNALVE